MLIKRYCNYCPMHRFNIEKMVDICTMKEKYPDFKCFVGSILRDIYSEINDKLIDFFDELNEVESEIEAEEESDDNE